MSLKNDIMNLLAFRLGVKKSGAPDAKASIGSQMSTDCTVRFSCLLIHYSLHSLYSLLLTIFRDVIDERGIEEEDPSWLSC